MVVLALRLGGTRELAELMVSMMGIRVRGQQKRQRGVREVREVSVRGSGGGQRSRGRK